LCQFEGINGKLPASLPGTKLRGQANKIGTDVLLVGLHFVQDDWVGGTTTSRSPQGENVKEGRGPFEAGVRAKNTETETLRESNCGGQIPEEKGKGKGRNIGGQKWPTGKNKPVFPAKE